MSSTQNTDISIETLSKNISKINHRINRAAIDAGRNPDSISLLLATKTRTPETINQAIALGYGLIGENRAQELVEKSPLILTADTTITPRETHFIGALQSNKVNEVTALCDCIQTVDRLRIARRIHDYARERNVQKSIMVQVNTSLDPNKQGLLPDALPAFLEAITEYSNLHIRGLMTIGLQTDNESLIRKGFADLRLLSESMRQKGLMPSTATDLSMGMSSDLELAILEGSTIIRIGSDIFGAR